MTERSLSEAIVAAEALHAKAAQHGLDIVYKDLDDRIEVFETSGYPIESVVPAGEAAGLGFALRGKDGKGFFEVYAELLREKLCAEGGEFNKLINDGIHAGVGSIITLIALTLGTPAVALGLLVPIAVIIAQTGLEAFCKVSRTSTS